MCVYMGVHVHMPVQGHENDNKYFGCYADFAHQELMLNDVVRTSMSVSV